MAPLAPWFSWFVAGGALLLLGAMLALRHRRLRSLRPELLASSAAGLVFHESFASVRSHRSRLSRVAGRFAWARISLTPDALLVRPHFPFSLVWPFFDLVHAVPLAAIVEMSEISSRPGYPIVIRFRDYGRLDLYLLRKSEFWHAVARALEPAS